MNLPPSFCLISGSVQQRNSHWHCAWASCLMKLSTAPGSVPQPVAYRAQARTKVELRMVTPSDSILPWRGLRELRRHFLSGGAAALGHLSLLLGGCGDSFSVAPVRC